MPIAVEVVADGLEVPWSLAFLPDGDILVTERPGRVILIDDGTVAEAPVVEVDIAEIEVAFGSEGGLLGILLHPEFDQNRLFYLYLTATKADGIVINRLLRYSLADDNRTAELDRVILDDIEAGGHHQGGRMHIGPDGKLYVGVGAFEPELAQDPTSLAGKLLRLELDGSIPTDNPDPESYVVISGIRNTQGYDWLTDDTLLMVDHGPSALLDPGLAGHDELNVVRFGDNLGWPRVVGCGSTPDFTPPAIVWKRAMPPGGATFYRADRIPEWQDAFLVASLGLDRGGQHLQVIHVNPQRPNEIVSRELYLHGDYERLRTVTVGPDGLPYITTSNCDGRGECPDTGDMILRIAPSQ